MGLAVGVLNTVPVDSTVNAASVKIDSVSFNSNIPRTLDQFGEDYFKVTLKKDQPIKLKFKDTKNKEIYVVVYSGVDIPAFQKILSEDKSGQESSISESLYGKYTSKIKIVTAIDNMTGENSIGINKDEIGLKKGTYLIGVMSESSLKKAGNKYNLSITKSSKKNVEFEENDSIKLANAIKPNKLYSAALLNYFDAKDYYKINIPKAGKLTLKSTVAVKGNTKFTIYNANKKVVSKTVKKVDKTTTVKTAVKKGTYYIKVEKGSSGKVNNLKYNLKATFK